MYFVVDIGNSNIVLGTYYDGVLSHTWRVETHIEDSGINALKERIVRLLFEAKVHFDEIDTVVLSSVVPMLTHEFELFLNDFFRTETIVVGPAVYPHLELEVLRPNEIGSDLVCNAYGAMKRYNRDCIVVDMGTALTVLAIGQDWRIAGVSIAPGIGTAMQSLRNNTAQLPEVTLEFPSSVLGKSTQHAMQSGVMVGYVGLINNLISEYRAAWKSDAIAIATGGLSGILPPLRDTFHEVNINLTLDGLYAIGQKVRGVLPKRDH